MSLELAYILFIPTLAGIIVGSIFLSRGIQELGNRFAILPGFLGLITALASDSPEISSAVTALFAGEKEVGIGVVLGSNLFNLAALLGVACLLSPGLALKRSGLIFNGGVSLLVAIIAALLIFIILPASAGMALIGFIFFIYAFVLWAHRPEIRRLPLPRRISSGLARIVGEVHQHASRKEEGKQEKKGGLSYSTTLVILIVIGALLLIVLSSYEIVHATLRIAGAWGISKNLVGVLVLAALTGLPNVYTSARLTLRKKGMAMVSEALNSNTINIVVGIGLPALIFGVSSKPIAVLEIWWLLGLTALALSLSAWYGALKRKTGIIIIAIYIIFVAVRVYIR